MRGREGGRGEGGRGEGEGGGREGGREGEGGGRGEGNRERMCDEQWNRLVTYQGIMQQSEWKRFGIGQMLSYH